MTSTSATILARIDDLILDLVRQLAAQTATLLSDATPDAAPQSQQGDRPAKRSKQQAKPKPEPLRLRIFAAKESGADEDAERQEAPTVSNVSFPTKSVVGIRRFAQVLRVLELIQQNLLRGTLVTKRDIYYQSLSLFPSQSASDRIISQLVTLLGVTDRLELGIVGSPRGIFSGSLKLSLPCNDSQVYNCTFGQTTLIPTEINDSWHIDLPCPTPLHHIVLIVEKEAVFKHLLQTTTALPAQILITGKGCPDRATAKLVRLLSNHRCSHCGGAVEVRGFFDGDPYGVDVWRQYRLHSAVRWVGVDVRDFEEKGEGGLVRLRNDERKTAVRLLRGLSRGEDGEVRRRLTDMLLGGYKVEIEAAYEFVAPTGEKGLVAYMEHKLARG